MGLDNERGETTVELSEAETQTSQRLEELRQEISTMEEKDNLSSQEQERLEELRQEKNNILSKTRQELEDTKEENETNEEAEKYPDEKERDDALNLIENISDIFNLDTNALGGLFGTVMKLITTIFGGKWSASEDGQLVREETPEETVDNYRQEQRIARESGEYDKEFNFEELISSKEGQHFEQYADMIIDYALRFDIEPGLMLQLFIREGSKGDVRAGPGGRNSAGGFGQITNQTWDFIADNLAPRNGFSIDKENDRFDPKKQILASCIYLDYCAKVRGVDHKNAVIYYHMGPGGINDETAQRYISQNPAIARVHGPGRVTVQSYEEAASRYYLT